MTPGRPLARLAALAIAIVAAAPASARDRIHVVAAGESASSLAKAYYGDADLASPLLGYNGRTSAVLRPGERLAIPFCAVHRVRPGETWGALAERALGRTSAAATLAELNGSTIDAPLRLGDPVVFPVVVRHALAKGETLASLASRFYGDDRKAGLVGRFAGIDDATHLPVGTVVSLPLVGFRQKEPEAGEAAAPAKRPEPARPSPTPAPAPTPAPTPAPARYASPLGEARTAFAVGEFDHAREVLERIRAAVSSDGTDQERLEEARLLAFVYVAFERSADACAAYREHPGAADGSDLDPDLVSPLIRKVLAGCPPAGPTSGELDRPASGPHIPSHADPRP